MKKFIIISIIGTALAYLSLYTLSYYVDPYGYYSRQNKFDSNLCYVNKTSILNNKILNGNGIYLIGSSRVMRIHPLMVEKYTTIPTYNINISGISIKEEVLLVKKLKLIKKDNRFIAGVDDFSINIDYQKRPEISNRIKQYALTLQNNTYFLSIDEILASLKVVFMFFKNTGYSDEHLKEDNTQYGFDHTKIIHDVTDGGLRNYTVDFNSLKEVGNLGTENDIFIIFPKYKEHYYIYNKYGVDEKYFEAIKFLVNNTKAQVWSFYQFNNITGRKENFDENGYHFKPKIGDMIIQKIYSKKSISTKEEFGYLITKDNIDMYISKIKLDLKTKIK